MHPYLKLLSLVSATLFFTLCGQARESLQAQTVLRSNALAQASAKQNRKAEAEQLYQEGLQQFKRSEFRAALETFKKALALFKEIGDHLSEGRTLNYIGRVYDNLGQYPKALEFYQQALAISKEIGDRSGEGTTLNNIGAVYDNLGQYPKALEFYQQALAISEEIGDRSGEGRTLNNIGLVYDNLGQYPKALEFYQQALAISKEIGDRSGEGITLSNLGYLLNQQKQPELAIVFFKQSVNIREIIRQELRVLSRDQQETYTKTVADAYRTLADLLLQKDRVLEAQRVLDLLKVQELEDYLRNVRGTNQTVRGIENLPPEQQLLEKYAAIQDKAIELGKELTKLRQIPEANRTPTQQKRISELVDAEQVITKQFNNFINSPSVVALVNQLSRTAKRQNLDLPDLNSLRDNLRHLQSAVLLYPLILEDRLELIITTPDSPPIRRTVAVKRVDLNRAIVEFRKALQDPTADAKAPAQKLYNWLIKPLEADLNQAAAQTIIYAPDGQLRYIPLAALYDGKQWLVERYRVNNITAQSLTDFNTKPQAQLHVLAAAFTKGSYAFKVGTQDFTFNGLPFAGREVDNLVSAIPGTTKLLDGAFSLAATASRMNDYSIIHFATHAAFLVGQPEDSFILFGNGERASLRDVESWSLPNVDLVMLSACETGLGGKLGNGEEILGLGYQFQRTGARAAIASLWSVDDGGTQALMSAFYTALKQGNITKAEALQRAQIALITNNDKAGNQQRGIVGVQPILRGLTPSVANRLGHPYYWAPFILIGNGL